MTKLEGRHDKAERELCIVSKHQSTGILMVPSQYRGSPRADWHSHIDLRLAMTVSYSQDLVLAMVC